MKTKLFLLLPCFSLFTLHPSFSQTWQWASKGYATAISLGNDGGYSLATDKEGNVIMGGRFWSHTVTFGSYTLTNPSGYANGFFVKYDKNGNVLWAKSTQGINGQVYVDLVYVATDNRNNIIITGDYDAPGVVFGKDTLWKLNSSNDQNIFLAKYDANGNVLWATSAKAINKNDYLEVGVGAVVTDSSCNIYVPGGYADSSVIFGSDTLRSSIGSSFFLKYDSNGNILWAKNEPLTGYLAADRWDNLYISASLYASYFVFNKDTLKNNSAYENIIAAKYDAMGNPLWARVFGSRNGADGGGIAVDGSANVYVTGSTSDTTYFGPDTLVSMRGSFLLVKYDSSGNPIWARGSNGPRGAGGVAVTVAPNGNIFANGNLSGAYSAFGTDTLFTKGAYDIFLTEYSPSGALLWLQSVGCVTGNGSETYPCATDLFGNAYIAGTFGDDSLIFGTDTLYCRYNAAFIAKAGDFLSAVGQVKSERGGLKVYPNPFRNSTTVLLNNSGKYCIELDDITGRKLQEFMFTGKEYEMNVQGLAAGLYFLRAFDSEKNVIGIAKIVIE